MSVPAKKIEVLVPADVEQLIAERARLISKNDYRRGDGDRLYQIQVLLCSYFCDVCEASL